MPHLKVHFDKTTGLIQTRVEGACGPHCSKVVDFFTNGLQAVLVKDEAKPEFYQDQQVLVEQQTQAQ